MALASLRRQSTLPLVKCHAVALQAHLRCSGSRQGRACTGLLLCLGLPDHSRHSARPAPASFPTSAADTRADMPAPPHAANSLNWLALLILNVGLSSYGLLTQLHSSKEGQGVLDAALSLLDRSFR